MRFKKVFYILGALLLALLAFTVYMEPPMMWLYLCAESGAIALTVVMYFSLVRPVSAILLGMDLLRAQDFSSRLAKVGQLDADKLVELFNRLMTQIKNERLRLREQNYFLQMLIDASPLGILTLDFDGHISQANPAAVRMLDAARFDEIAGRKVDELAAPLAHGLVSLADDETRTIRLADTMIYRCSRLSFRDSGFKRIFFLIETLTDEVMKAEKTAYEKVIRMIAHEVNNTMAGVGSLLETLSVVLADDAELAEALVSCRDRIGSMSTFITSYANVVKIPPLHTERVDLNEQLRANMPFLEGIVSGRGISLRFEPSDTPVPVVIDRILIEQVLVNIVKNAAESIGSDGEITIHVGMEGLTVIDNGEGITEATAQRLFSPFYSTKPGGQGLGLMFVSEILRRHGFRFSLATDPTDGLTRFSIRF